MIGVQEYRSICCGVVCYVYSNGTYCLTTVTTVATRVVVPEVVPEVVSVIVPVAWHNIQKHNYILYVCIIY